MLRSDCQTLKRPAFNLKHLVAEISREREARQGLSRLKFKVGRSNVPQHTAALNHALSETRKTFPRCEIIRVSTTGLIGSAELFAKWEVLARQAPSKPASGEKDDLSIFALTP